MEIKYQQRQRGKQRDNIVKEWYGELPMNEKAMIDKAMRELSSGLRHTDIIGMLQLLIALDCSGKTSFLIGGKNG